MAELNFLVMDRLQAARFRNETANDANRLDPREVTGGTHRGKFAVNASVLIDPAHAARRDAFLMLPEVALDTATAFFVPEEE